VDGRVVISVEAGGSALSSGLQSAQGKRGGGCSGMRIRGSGPQYLAVIPGAGGLGPVHQLSSSQSRRVAACQQVVLVVHEHGLKRVKGDTIIQPIPLGA